MIRRRRGRRARAAAWLAAAIAAATGGGGLAFPGASRAANIWDGGGNNNNWNTQNNWDNNTVPFANAPVTFAGTVDPAPIVNVAVTVSSLTFANNGAPFNITGTSVVTINSSAGILQGDNDLQTIAAPIALAAAQTWNASAGDLLVSGSVNTNGNTLTIDGGSDTTISGVISGAGGVTKTGTGLLTLSGASANTHTGTTTVNAGTLDLGKTGGVAAIVGNLTIGDGTGSDIVSLLAANQISGSGTVTLNSSGVLQLNSFADQVNNVVFNGGQITTSNATGALQLAGALSTNAAAASAVISGPGALTLFTNNKTFTVADGGATIDLDISSSIGQDVAGRSITKAGAGTMRLSGANSFSGGLTLGSGTLILNSNTAAGTGTLTLGGGTVTTESSASLANAVNVSAATLVQNPVGQTLTFSGVVSGSGALTLGSSGAPGDLRLAGTSANTHNGTIGITNGTLSLAKTAGINAIGGNVIIGDASTATPVAQLNQAADNQVADSATITVRRSGLYDLATGNRSEAIGGLTLEDGKVTTGTGVLTILGPLSSTNVTGGAVSTVDGNLSLGGATRAISSGTNNTLNLNAAISSGGIAFSGAGTINLNGANTFAGGFDHGGTGTVNIGHNAALGTGTVTTAAGATRTFSITGGSKTLANAFVLNGNAQFTLPALTLSLNGNISGPGGLTTSGGGNLVLGGGANTYSGVTTVNGTGKLIVTANNALGAISGNTVVNPGGALELAGVNYAAAEPLTLNGGGSVNPSFASTTGASTWAGAITLAGHSKISASGGSLTVTGAIDGAGFNLTLDGASTSTFSGAIGGGATSLNKMGGGVATLAGTNGYGGATNVLAGILRVAAAGGNAIPDGSAVSIEPGAALEFAANETIGTIQAGSLGTIVVNSGVTATVQAGTFGGVIAGSGGTFAKTTAGTLALQGLAANTFTGTTEVLAGTLNLGKSIADAAIAGNLIIGDNSTSTPTAFVTLGSNEQIANNAAVTIRRSGRLDLASGNRSETIGALTLEDAQVATGAGTLTLTGTLTSSNVAPGGVSSISGNLNLGGATRFVDSGDGNTLNIDAVVANGGIVVQGNGIVNLNAANTFAGGFEHASGATMTITNNSAFGTGTIQAVGGATRSFVNSGAAQTLANDFQLNTTAHFALAADLTLSGAIGGLFGISKDGPAALTLSGTGTFGNGVFATAGTLIVNGNTAAGTGTLTLGPIIFRSDAGSALANAVDLTGGTVFHNISAAPGGFATFTGVVSGGGDLTIANPDGSSRIALRLGGTSANTYTGTTHIIDGTLQLAKTAGVNAVVGNIIVGDNSTGAMTGQLLPLSDNQIADSATVTVRRSGLYNLAETNRQESIGALTLEDGAVITGSGMLTILGPLTVNNVTPAAVSTITGNLGLGGGTRVINAGLGSTLNLDAVVSDGGLAMTGSGAVHLNGANTFAGGFDNAGGVVVIGNNAAFGTGTVTTTAGATRVFTVSNGAKTLANNFLLNATSHLDLPENLTLNGNIAGAGGLTKIGAGTLTLGGAASSFAGVTTVTEGKLTVTANNALGATSGGTIILGTDVALQLSHVNYAAPEPLSLNGAGGPNPSLVSVTGVNTWAGPILLEGHSIISAAGGTLNVTGAINGGGFNVTLDGALGSTYSGAISGGATSLFKRGTGIATVAGTNTYGGGTFVQAGTLRIAGTGNAVPDAAGVTIDPGATLEFAANENIGAIQPGSGGAIVLNPGVVASIVSGSFGGVISGGGGSATLAKVGAGTLTLSAVNTFTNQVAINGGTLRIEGGSAIADTTAVSLANAAGVTFDVPVSETIAGLSGGGASGGAVTLGSGAVLTVTGGGTFGGVISGAAELAKGSGADLLLRGTNTYTGRTTINGGTVDILADAALGPAPGAFVADQVSLDNGGTLRLGDGTVTIPANRGITIGANGGRIQAGNADALTVASRLTGAGTVTFAAFGAVPTMPVFTPTAANTTFTGKTVIDNAVVTIANDGNLSAAPGAFLADKLTLVNGGTLKITTTMSLPANRGITILNGGGSGGAFDVNSGQTLTTLSPMTGAGALTKRGSGTLNLSTAHSYTGKTIIDAGTVIAQQDASFGAAPAALVTDQLTINLATLRWTTNSAGVAATRGVRLGAPTSTFNVDAGVTMIINSPVSGTGGLQKIGPGTLNLMGSNSYTGSTSVGAGRLILNQSFSTNTSVAISAGTTLELAQPPNVTLKTTSVIATGKLDVKDNKVIITSQPIGTWNTSTSSYSGVTGMIASAYNNSTWSGSGLTTSMPEAIAGLTGLGVTTPEAASLSQFGGMSVVSGNVLVMYTYAGDLNFDGRVDAQDYGVIDNWVQFPGTTGYSNGDINYDGRIDAVDYGIIDNTIQLQGAPIPANGAPVGLSGVTAVPEPSALFVTLAAAGAGMLRRRRRPRHANPV